MGGWKWFNEKIADPVRELVDPLLPEAAKKFGTDTIQHWDSWVPQTVGAAFTAAGMPWVGLPIAGLGGAIHNYQDTGNYGKAAIAGLGSAATAYGGGNLLKSFGTNFVSQPATAGAGNATNAVATGTPNSTAFAAPPQMPSLASEFSTQQASQFGSGIPASGLGSGAYSGVNPGGSPLTAAFLAQEGGQVPGTASALPSVGGPAIGTVGEAAATPAQTSMFDKVLGAPGSLQRKAVGASIPLLGSASGPQAQTFNPQQSELFNQTVERVQSGNMVQLTDAQKQAITATYDEQYNTALTNLKQKYKALRPGSDIENDSSYRKDMQDLELDYATEKANTLTMAQWNFTQDQTSMLSQLAALDLYSLAQASGVSQKEAADFQEMLGQIGFMVAGSGGGSTKPGGGLMSLFQ